MSRIYDSWERLVAAVLRREQLWQLCHEQSRTPSLRSSVSSNFSSSFRFNASFSSEFDFANPEDGLFRSAQSLPFKTLAGIKANVRPETKEAAAELVISKGSPFAFSLEELLMAPSFVLGDKLGTFKNTYLVRFKEDTMVVVKRLGRGNATREKFQPWVKKTFERIEHENVVKFRGYYYLSGDEILAFYDYFPQGSVYTMLHGKKGESRVHLDWEARIRIAIGAAKGLLHIHRQERGERIHGNIKASNVFLNSQEYGCIYTKSANAKISKYHPPEVSIERMATQASDVYSFGVLLIELLSGRSPSLHSTGRNETFADWALHNARDDWTAVVFDTGLLKHPLAKQGMCDMLAIALSCVKKKPQERPNMKDVVEMLELIPTSTTFPV